MQEYLAELSGTLARKQQRKNTVLSQIHKQALLDKRASTYGFAIRPHNPAEVSDPKAAKHFLNEVRSELGHKISRINNPMLCSLDRDGEIAVRQHNDEIHRLLISRNRWLVRCAEVGVDLSPDEQQLVDRDRSGARLRKSFFGCAKELPEAQKAAEATAKRQRETDNEAEYYEEAHEDTVAVEQEPLIAVDEEKALGDDVISAYIASIRLAHDVCHASTPSSEEAERRREEAACTLLFNKTHHDEITMDISEYILDFVGDAGELMIASDEDVKRQLLERRKLSMKSQLSSMVKR
jgi:hypothetical protein